MDRTGLFSSWGYARKFINPPGSKLASQAYRRFDNRFANGPSHARQLPGDRGAGAAAPVKTVEAVLARRPDAWKRSPPLPRRRKDRRPVRPEDSIGCATRPTLAGISG